MSSREGKVVFELPVNDLLPLIGKQISICWDTYRISLNTCHIVVFTKGTTCVECGKQGTKWRLVTRKGGGLHFGLYTDDNILMTRDHIVPRSKYHLVYGTTIGRDSLDNSQPMCALCNSRKSNKMPEGVHILFTEENWNFNNWMI